MTSKTVAEILTAHGDCSRDGDAFEVPSAVQASVFASLGGENLLIERIQRVELAEDVLIASTSRSERFAVMCQDVRAIRFQRSDAQSAGYGRSAG